MVYKQTGKVGTFIDINYFIYGGPKLDLKISIDDEKGCLDCFGYNLAIEDKMNELINESNKIKTEENIAQQYEDFSNK